VSFITESETVVPQPGLKPVKVPVQVDVLKANGPEASLSVKTGQSIQVNVQFAPTAATPYTPPTVFQTYTYPPSNLYDSAAVLIIESDSWNESVTIPITAGVLGRQIPAPVTGLQSNSNYYLYNNCGSVNGLSVTIDVTQDIVSMSGPKSGVGFQLNAYAPAGAKSVWLQYFICVFQGYLRGGVEYWNTHFPPPSPLLVLDSWPGDEVPAGTNFKISLENDSAGNVSKVHYYVNGAKKGTFPIPEAFLVPAIAFQLDVVGPMNGIDANLSSGAGTITYEAPAGLTVLPALPLCANPSTLTGEKANTVYGFLHVQAYPQTLTTQTFNLVS
jgi:hypothetical protein